MTIGHITEPHRENDEINFPYEVTFGCREISSDTYPCEYGYKDQYPRYKMTGCKACDKKEREIASWLYANMGHSYGISPRWAYSWNEGVRLKQIRFRTKEDATLFMMFCK